MSNDKYLELYKIKSNLIDYNQNYLENSFNFSHNNEDYFLSMDASIYENLKETYNDKYEFIFPDILLDKNLYQSQSFGILDLQTNLKINNYDTNKTSKLLTNDFNWKSKYFNFKNGLRSSLLGKIKNVNYETKNILEFKEQTVNEVHGAIGYLSELELIKNTNNSQSLLTPKFLIRYAPGNMRKETEGTRLTPENSFSMDRSYQSYNLEKGLSATIGFDYELTKEDKDFQFSVGQIISDQNNDKISPNTSLNDKVSDLVGTSNLRINNNLSLKYNFSLDNNYEDLNYNEVETALSYNNLQFNLGYLQEKTFG